jgi:hypothetical protein
VNIQCNIPYCFKIRPNWKSWTNSTGL